jgi:hypothetical protein
MNNCLNRDLCDLRDFLSESGFAVLEDLQYCQCGVDNHSSLRVDQFCTLSILCISVKLRKEFKIDKPVQAERSSGYGILLRSSDGALMVYPELRSACSGLSKFNSLRSLTTAIMKQFTKPVAGASNNSKFKIQNSKFP